MSDSKKAKLVAAKATAKATVTTAGRSNTIGGVPVMPILLLAVIVGVVLYLKKR